MADYIDPVGLAIFGEGMNDEQKAGFFSEMAEQINAQLLEDDSIENHEELAYLTYQVVNMIPKAGIKDPKKSQDIYYEITTTVINQLEGSQHQDMVDANSLSSYSLQNLANASTLII